MYRKPYHLEPSDPTARKVADAVGYSGRTFKARIQDDRKVALSGTQWDGGSRSEYFAVTLTEPIQSQGLSVQSTWPTPSHDPIADIPQFGAIVEWVTFCGNDHGLTIHIGPDSVSALLPAPSEVGDALGVVLCATSTYKNSYGGETGIRFREAHSETGITRESWDAAITSAIAEGYLRKNGSITPKGRNAAPDRMTKNLFR